MSYHNLYGMVSPGLLPGSSMGGVGNPFGYMPGLLPPQASARNLGLLYRPWEPAYADIYGPSGMYGFSWPTLPNYSSATGGSGDRSWSPNWDDVNPPEPDPMPTTDEFSSGNDQTDGMGGNSPGTMPGEQGYSQFLANQLREQRVAETTMVPGTNMTVAEALAQGWRPSVGNVSVLPSMNLNTNTSINPTTMGLNPQVVRDLTGQTLPGYRTPNMTTSVVATAIQPDQPMTVQDITNDFGGGGNAGSAGKGSFGGMDAGLAGPR